MAACRSCGAEILWATTVNGKKIPLDAEPAERPNGLFRLERVAGVVTALSTAGDPVYLSHWVTCPSAEQHRKAPLTSAIADRAA